MTDDAPDRSDLLAYLDFHVASGVDAVLDEVPHDRFAESEAKAAARPAAALPPVPPPAPAPRPPSRGSTFGRSAAAEPGEAADDARELARAAGSLAELEALLARFESCPLRFTAKNLVFADGEPSARVMFVGEAPGADEDRVGKPFMGRSGQLLDRMMAAIGLDRSNAYVGNIVPWRPPGNRSPTPQEVATCKPFIERQIALADPDILVCLGGVATQTLAGTRDGILKSRGRWFPYQTGRREIRLLATLHPAYLLRQPLQKRLAWRDFRALRAALDAGP
ncbi:uracil-DNA glycosylase [Methylobacterium nodulans]|uniref:Type-4 uracil-DNA glycosylase n=1 Tax=Methylobacterium nodulans (strain LMG 21967 / CNCM I-2342 / ORS 2060) TaxID=460265 RepID=B8IU42_METNO|nr:uracil-DNA glycosylase [Methylobacterium nodulans]ACL60900.1 phage SPO1 DNA polymerase-related protein [Methylobacterium nodulans ORS 2060]